MTTMRDWRQAKRFEVLAAAKKQDAEKPAPGTLAEDVALYLASVKSMPRYDQRAYHLQLWVEALGADRKRTSITAIEIQTVLENWFKNGQPVKQWTRDDHGKAYQKVVGQKAYSESEINKRRTALQRLYTALDGKSGQNPVRDVARKKEADAEPRGLMHPADMRRLIASMPDSPTKARVAVWMWTGIPPEQLEKIKAEHIDLKGKQSGIGPAVYVTRRNKGGGTTSRWQPLLPDAIEGFKLFIRWECCEKSFSRSSLNHSVKRAAKRTGLDAPNVEGFITNAYDLRHSFASMTFAQTGDERATQELLDHRDLRTTQRYTKRAVSPRVARAMDVLRKALGKKRRKKPARSKARRAKSGSR